METKMNKLIFPVLSTDKRKSTFCLINVIYVRMCQHKYEFNNIELSYNFLRSVIALMYSEFIVNNTCTRALSRQTLEKIQPCLSLGLFFDCVDSCVCVWQSQKCVCLCVCDISILFRFLYLFLLNNPFCTRATPSYCIYNFQRLTSLNSLLP